MGTITNDTSENQSFRLQKSNWQELVQRIWTSRNLIFTACAIGVVLGIIIVFGTPKEYTANTLIALELTHRRTSSSISELADMAGVALSSSTTERDAIYPSLYPTIVKSTPFLIRLFDVKVRQQKDTTTLTLAQYMNECQETPWWSVVTSAPSQLLGLTLSLFDDAQEEEIVKTGTKVNPFRLTRKEAAMVGTIASRIAIEIDKKKKTINLSVIMQDPLVAVAVADTVQARLREYVTEYRTRKARRMLTFKEKLCKEAKAEYHVAQEKYARYADANQGLVMMVPRAELSRLRSDMELALFDYNQRKKQVEAAQAKVEKIIPVYVIVQPAVVPLVPSKPRKTLILVGCILLSAAGGIGWVLYLKDFIQKIRKKGIAFRQHVNQ